MLSQQREHVVKESNARSDPALPRAIKAELEMNVSFVRLAIDMSGT
jgi:hypothetical protein